MFYSVLAGDGEQKLVFSCKSLSVFEWSSRCHSQRWRTTGGSIISFDDQ